MTPASDEIRRQHRRVQRYLRGNQSAKAQAILESLLQQHPEDTSARLQLGEILRSRGHLQAATQQWMTLVPRLPDDATFIAQLVPHLYFNGESLAARRCFEHSAVASAREPQVLQALARAHKPLDEPAVTLALLERAIAAGVDTPEEHFFHAMMLGYTGHTDAAIAGLEACVERWPNFSGAVRSLMHMRRQTDTRHLELLRSQLSQLQPNTFAHAEFQFALFKLLDDLGRHDEAWSALASGNATMSALGPYDATADNALTESVMRLSQAMADAPAAGDADEGPMPIFIVGLPRSGTTLLERMMSGHTDVASAGELKDFLHQLRWAVDIPGKGLEGLQELIEHSGHVDFADLGRRYLAQTRWRARGHRFYIDKLPNNHLFVHWIHRALPQAPILHIQRDPMDVCFSNFKAMFGSASLWCYDMRALAHHHGLYRRLTAHWNAILPGRMLDVSYAQLVTDPRTVMRRILDHCGLALEETCLQPATNTAPVSTPSSAQVREPVHTRNLGAWRHYVAQLAPLCELLDEPH